MANIRRTQIAYRCPECASVTVGFLGGLSAVTDMLRLRCTDCGTALDIKKRRDEKVELSVPCVYCKTNHSFVTTPDVITRGALTRFNCPYSSMAITFIGDEDEIAPEIERSADDLTRIMQSLEAETVSDIQPQDVGEDSVPPDPAIYDVFNFLLRDLEYEGAVKCPCDNGEYDLRFTDTGMQIYCKNCGASKSFTAMSQSAAEEYLTLDEIKLG